MKDHNPPKRGVVDGSPKYCVSIRRSMTSLAVVPDTIPVRINGQKGPVCKAKRPS
jgi:hypothetical protein